MLCSMGSPAAHSPSVHLGSVTKSKTTCVQGPTTLHGQEMGLLQKPRPKLKAHLWALACPPCTLASPQVRVTQKMLGHSSSRTAAALQPTHLWPHTQGLSPVGGHRLEGHP